MDLRLVRLPWLPGAHLPKATSASRVPSHAAELAPADGSIAPLASANAAAVAATDTSLLTSATTATQRASSFIAARATHAASTALTIPTASATPGVSRTSNSAAMVA